MALGAAQIRTLLASARASWRRAQEQVASAAAALRQAQDRLELCRRRQHDVRPAAEAAAARANRDDYLQRLRRLDGELVEQVGQAHDVLERRRGQLVEAARQVRLYERLAERLEQDAARRLQRHEQEVIDQFSQRPGERL